MYNLEKTQYSTSSERENTPDMKAGSHILKLSQPEGGWQFSNAAVRTILVMWERVVVFPRPVVVFFQPLVVFLYCPPTSAAWFSEISTQSAQLLCIAELDPQQCRRL